MIGDRYTSISDDALCRLLLLALRHFEGCVQPEELISSYLLCKSRWSVRKHIREMSSSSRSAADNVIKVGVAAVTSHSPATVARLHLTLLLLLLLRCVCVCFSQMYLKHKVMPTLPLACARVQPEDQCPPVDRTRPNMPNWLKVLRTHIRTCIWSGLPLFNCERLMIDSRNW